jgi:hypothetical protein
MTGSNEGFSDLMAEVPPAENYRIPQRGTRTCIAAEWREPGGQLQERWEETFRSFRTATEKFSATIKNLNDDMEAGEKARESEHVVSEHVVDYLRAHR